MKKTLVALAVSAIAATSANAAVVYNQGGTKANVDGEFRVILKKESNNRLDLQNDDSRLNFSASHDLGNGLSALGYVRIQATSSKFAKDFDLKKLYAGFAKDMVGTLTFGKQSTTADDVQLGDYAYVWGGNNNLKDSGDKVVKFKSADFNGFSFGADYVFGNADKSLDKEDAYGVSAFYTTQVAADALLNFAAGYTKDNSTDTKAYRLASEFVSGPFAVAYNFGRSKVNGDKTTYHLVGFKYDVAPVSTVYAQYKREKNNDTLNNFILGADYKLHTNVVTFVEYSRDQTNHDNQVGAGLRVTF